MAFHIFNSERMKQVPNEIWEQRTEPSYDHIEDLEIILKKERSWRHYCFERHYRFGWHWEDRTVKNIIFFLFFLSGGGEGRRGNVLKETRESDVIHDGWTYFLRGHGMAMRLIEDVRRDMGSRGDGFPSPPNPPFKNGRMIMFLPFSHPSPSSY